MHVVVNTFGTFIGVKDQCFVISNKEGEKKISPDKVKTLSLSKGITISSDAIMLAIDQQIDILFTDISGKPHGRVWSHRYGSISTIRKNQVMFSRSMEGVYWVRDILAEKLNNQKALLYTFALSTQQQDEALQDDTDKIEALKEKILQEEAASIDAVADSYRGWEGNASKIYFRRISKLLPENYQFAERSRHPSRDMFNCLLNYGYGVLYGRIEGALIKAGLDPYVGIMHRDEYNRPVMVYDVIEKFRVWIDYVVVHLMLQNVIFPDFFDIENGNYWLNTDGKRILIQSINDYFDEIINMSGKRFSRAVHIENFAHELAAKLKSFQS